MMHAVTLEFAGCRAGTASMTWAQHQVWDWLHDDFPPGEHGRLNPSRVLALPPETRLDSVVDAIRALVVRHDALRTRFVRDGTGPPAQRVAGEGAISIEVFDARDDGASVAAEIRSCYAERGIDVFRGWPLQVGIVARDGIATHVVLVASRLVTDAWGFRNLRRQFEHELYPGRSGSLPADPAPQRQPLEQAAVEQSDEGARLSGEAVGHWRAQLTSAPQATIPHRSGPTETARTIQLTMTSSAVARSLAALTQRYRTQPPALVLAALASALSVYTELARCTVMLHCGNRVWPELHQTVSSMKQHTLVTVDTAGASFRDIARRAASALMEGYLHGQYDHQAASRTRAAVRLSRGIDVVRSVGFNDLRLFQDDLRPVPAVDAPDPTPLTGIFSSMAETVIRRATPETVRTRTDLMFYLNSIGERACFTAYVDACHVPAEDGENLLRAMERLLVAAATRDDALADWKVVTDLAGPKRDDDWAMIDHSWIHLPSTTQLIADVVAPHPFTLFVDPADGPRLRLFVATAEPTVTPASLHSAAVRKLTGVHAVMAPHTYTVFRTAPDDRTDLDAWRAGPVVSTGSGR